MCAMAQNTSECQEYAELPRIPIPRTWVNKGNQEGAGAATPRPLPGCYRGSSPRSTVPLLVVTESSPAPPLKVPPTSLVVTVSSPASPLKVPLLVVTESLPSPP